MEVLSRQARLKLAANSLQTFYKPNQALGGGVGVIGVSASIAGRPQMSLSVQAKPERRNRAQRRAKASDERRVRPRFGGDEHHVRPRFVSIREACRYLGCSRSHFYAELLPKVKTVPLGKRRLVDFDSLEELGDNILAG